MGGLSIALSALCLGLLWGLLRQRQKTKKLYRQMETFLDGQKAPLEISLGESPSARLQNAAAREDDVTVLDDRESQTSRNGSSMRRIVFFFCLSIGMLLLTVLLLCGSILRQIRGETRTVGTLRAVGCDERSLTQLFFRQIPETAGLAWLLVVGLYLFSAWGYLQYNWWEIRINAITSIFTALLLTELCYLVIRRKVKKMLEGSIVESIREE